MRQLQRRGEDIAREEARRALRGVADALSAIIGEAAVTIEGTAVVARGKGLKRRWLDDSRLRFARFSR